MLRSNPAYRQCVFGPRQIEKVFLSVVLDLGVPVVLDRVDEIPSGYAIQSHDMHGPLPTVSITETGDSFLDKDAVDREACKLTAIVSQRERLLALFPGAKFLPPTRLDGKHVVGLRLGRRTFLGEGESFCDAYRDLTRQCGAVQDSAGSGAGDGATWDPIIAVWRDSSRHNRLELAESLLLRGLPRM